MEITIYIDVLWMRTFLVGLVTAIFVNIWMKQERTVGRILWMTALSAGAETMWFVLNGYTGMFAVGSVIFRLLLIFFLYRPQKTGIYMRLVLWSFFATLVLGGMLHMFQRKVPETMWFPFGLMFGAGVMILALLLEAHRMRNDTQLFSLRLYQGGRCVEVLGLWDTGNRLVDPYIHEPVHLLSRTKLTCLGVREENSRLIPYVSLGRKDGLLQVWSIDKMEYKGKIYAPVVVGAAEDILFEGKDYQMILSADWNRK